MTEAEGWCAPPEIMCNCDNTYRECGGACMPPVDWTNMIDLPSYVVSRSELFPAPPAQEPPASQ